MEKFIETRLSGLLGFPIPRDMIEHIVSLNTEPLIREYFEGLLDRNDVRHRQFISEYINKKNLRPPRQKAKKKVTKPSAREPECYEIKSDFDELERQYQVGVKKEEKDEKAIAKKTKKKEEKTDIELLEEVARKYDTPFNKYKKTTFIPIEYNQPQSLLPGRRFCGCFARQHNQINNCQCCGRIQCEQEGSGPCLFCGTLIVTNEEEKILERENKESSNLITSLLSQPKPAGWEEAVANQKKLHYFDKTKKDRQQIFDDQTDYYTIVSSWTTDIKEFNNVNELAMNMKQNADRIRALRLANSSTEKVKTVSADFKDNIIITEPPVKKFNSKFKPKPNGIQFDDAWRKDKARELFLDPNIAELEEDVELFIESLPELKMPELREKRYYQDPHTFGLLRELKIDEEINESYDWDSEFWELNDYFDQLGLCITIRQPYASLVIAGIKKHEGRKWSSDIRGPLWIAAGAYKPTKEEIDIAENFYKNRLESTILPSKYPTSRLLGRVQVKDWLDRETYLKMYPNGECDDDYSMILEEPIPLPILLPISGCKGIYMLPKKMHTAAGLLLRKLIRNNPSLVVGQ